MFRFGFPATPERRGFPSRQERLIYAWAARSCHDMAGLMWQALFIMFIAMSMIPVGDTAGKLLTSAYDTSPFFVAWSRFGIGALVVLPFVRADTVRLMTDWRVWFRAGLLTGGLTCIQVALTMAPMADTFAAFFIGPIISYWMSAVFLGERVTPARTALMAIGFAGVVIVVRPGLDMNPGLALALLAGLFYGGFLTSSRWLSAVGRPSSLLFTQMFMSFVMMTPFFWNSGPAITLPIAGLTITSALFSMGGNFLLLFAYARAPASALAPLVYFQLIAAVGLGWSVFGDLPDVFTVTGLCLIVSAGVASALLNTRRSAIA